MLMYLEFNIYQTGARNAFKKKWKLEFNIGHLPYCRVSAQSLHAKLESLTRAESTGANSLDVPYGMPSVAERTDDAVVSVNITVPNAKLNVVAPWEDE